MEKIRVVAMCSQCECPASSNLRRRHLGKIFFNEESAHSLPLENVVRVAEACERRRWEANENSIFIECSTHRLCTYTLNKDGFYKERMLILDTAIKNGYTAEIIGKLIKKKQNQI